VASLLDGLLNYSSTLKMEAIRSSEMSLDTQQTTWCYIPEDCTLVVTSTVFATSMVLHWICKNSAVIML
jgi:hypothetical protein